MAKEFNRTQRVEEQMQRELAVLIQQEIKDPRLGMVTVSAVKVTQDLSHGKVYITVLNDERESEITVSILNHAAGYLRHELGRRMHLRVIPELHFVYDKSIAHGAHLSSLIDAAVAEDKLNADKRDKE